MTTSLSHNSTFEISIQQSVERTIDPALNLAQFQQYSAEARSCSSKAIRYRIAAFALCIIPVVGWFAALHLSMKEREEESRLQNLHQMMYTCLKSKEDQITIDLQRGFLLSLNGKRYSISNEARKKIKNVNELNGLAAIQARAFINDLIQLKIPDEEKFKVITLAQQALFAKFIQCKAQLVAAAKQHPVSRNPITQKLEFEGSRTPVEYMDHLYDLKPENQAIEFTCKDGRSTVKSCYRAEVKVDDELAETLTPVFEMDAPFEINLKSDLLTAKPMFKRLLSSP